MKTTDLIERVAITACAEKSAAKKAIEAVIGGIIAAAKKDEEATLPGFGNFKVRDSAALHARNPGTGATIEIAASRKLGFTLAKQVKDALAA